MPFWSKPPIFKRDNPNALPKFSHTHFDHEMTKEVMRKPDWHSEDMDAVPEQRAKIVEDGRKDHVRKRNAVLDRNESRYVKGHYEDYQTHQLGNRPTAHAEEVRWHDLVLPRLRAYGLGMLPDPRASREEFSAGVNLTRGRLYHLEQEIEDERKHLDRVIEEKQGRLTAAAVLRTWNGRIVVLEHKLASLPEDPSDLRDVEEQLSIEGEIDFYLVAEHKFIDLSSRVLKHEPGKMDAEVVKSNTLARVKEYPLRKTASFDEGKGNESVLHKMWSPAGPDARHYMLNGRYWALVFTKFLMLDRAEAEHHLRQRTEGRDRREEEEKVHESQLIQERIWTLFPHHPPATAHEAFDMLREVEAVVKRLSLSEKKKAYRRIDKKSRGEIKGAVHDLATGRAQIAPPDAGSWRHHLSSSRPDSEDDSSRSSSRPPSPSFDSRHLLPLQGHDGEDLRRRSPSHHDPRLGQDDGTHTDSGSEGEGGGPHYPPGGGRPLPTPPKRYIQGTHPNVGDFSFPASSGPPSVPPRGSSKNFASSSSSSPRQQLSLPPRPVAEDGSRVTPAGPRGQVRSGGGRHLWNPMNSLNDARFGRV
ncbi:hypothetical protein JCM11251_003987 [Rhodosporidiobolus azoricus]